MDPANSRASGSPVKRVRVRQLILGALGTVGAIAVFTIALAVAVLVHLDLPASQRVVVSRANAILAGMFAGEVRLERLESVGLHGARGVHVRVRDPEGVQVLDVDGIAIQVDPTVTLRSLFRKGPVRIDVPSAKLGTIDTNLDTAADGSLRLGNAFAAKHVTAPEKAGSKPGRGIQVDAPAIEFAHAWIHGTIRAGAPRVDVDLSRFVARAHLDPSVVRAEVERLSLVARGTPRNLDPKGVLGGRMELPLSSDPALAPALDAHVIFEGDVGGMPTSAQAGIRGRSVYGRVDAFDRTGASAQTVLDEIAIRDSLSLHAEAQGELGVDASSPHRIEGSARLALGRATARAGARVEIGEATRADATVSVRHVDLARIAEGVPPSDLGLDGTTTVTLHGSEAEGHVAIDTLPGRVEGAVLPRAEVRGSFTRTTAHIRARTSPRVATSELQLPVDLAIDVGPRGDGKQGHVVDLAARARVSDLHRLPKVGGITGGSAELDAAAHLLLPENSFAATATAVVRKLSPGPLAVGAARIHARASGTLDRPVLDAEVQAREVSSGAISLATLDARARIETSSLPKGAGRAVVVRNPSITAVQTGRAPVTASAGLVRLRSSALQVDDAVVTGIGDPIRAEMHWMSGAGHDELGGTIDAPRIDVARVAGLLGHERKVTKGTLAIQGSGSLRDGDAKAVLHAEAADLATELIHDARAVLDATIDGHDLDLDAHAELADAGKLSVRLDRVVIAGPLADLTAWKRAYGRLRFEGELDAEKVGSLFPPGTLPVADPAGTITLQGRVGRDAEDAPPEVQLHAHTRGLVVAGRIAALPPIGGVRVESAPKWRSSDVDLGVDLRNDGPSGFTNIALHATDARGLVMALDAKAVLPYAEIAANPSVALERVLSAPIAVKLTVPPRRLDQLPAILGVKGLQGVAEADVDVAGTALEPTVHVVARGRGVRAPAMAPDAQGDPDLSLDYDGKVARLAVTLSSRGKRMVDATARFEGRVHELLAGHGPGRSPPEWNASGRVLVDAFPLETVPQLADRRLRGRLSGEVSLEGLHQDARVKGRLALDGLAVGRTRYQKGTISIDAAEGKVEAKARLDQKDGFLEASATGGMSWGGALAPAADLSRPAYAKLVARAFRASAVQPFLPPAVPSLDGRIDADAAVQLTPNKTVMIGTVTLRDGTVQLAALGEELRRVKGTLKLSPDGTIEVKDVEAHGARGEIFADARVKLDGVRFVEAVANVRIPSAKPLGVSYEGEPIGDVAGTVKLRANRSPNGLATALVVDVPKLEVELPQVSKTNVQTLEEKESIRIGVYRDPSTFIKLPLDKEDTITPSEKAEAAGEASRLEVLVNLGTVEVRRGNSARVTVKGNTKVTVLSGDPDAGTKSESSVTGQIQAVKGWIDVQGKRFEIEKGTITFNGETPPNPVIVATAGWTTADGTRVLVDYIGPVDGGKVVMRSEPPRPKNEILALVLFGTADGVNPTAPPPGKQPDGTTKAAVGLGGGFAAQGLTEALDDLAGIQATARIDTTRTNNPRPEVEIQISPKVSVAFAHVIGTPPITEPDKNLARVEWRFHARWSLQTTVGDRGRAMLDAIWQKRY